MRYLGGKTRIASELARVMRAASPGATRYVEPFIGGGSVFVAMAPHFEQAMGGDAMPDLAALWCSVAGGWVPPVTMTEDEWTAQRTAPRSALRAFAGFGCSFGGKWFGGFARANTAKGDPRDITNEAHRKIVRMAPAFRGRDLRHVDYQDWTPEIGPGTVVYCDPPYAGTTTYGGIPDFDTERFWKVAESWVRAGAQVFVSEYDAPAGWVPIWSKEQAVAVSLSNGSARSRNTERLYVHEGQSVQPAGGA